MMHNKISPRLFWLVLFIISIATAITIYTIQSFTTDLQVEKNTGKIKINSQRINDTAIREQQIKLVTDRQNTILDSILHHSGSLEKRQDNIMRIVNADVAYLKEQLQHDLYYDKLMNEKLNILLGQNNSINK